MKIKSASDSDQSRLTLILGAPRSGTTWLAKIFDSHPDVLYRHEPDLVVPDNRIPSICADENAPALIEAARGFVADLMHTHTLKTAGSLPVFPKRHDRPWTRVGRTAANKASSAAESNKSAVCSVAPASCAATAPPLPDSTACTS